ncbi:hypothetical protein [Streptomyces sp. CC208A]|uniref:hypothetical protein n=1 Tax=Streptomyces sp. CC208A TaxID=3044573 RepID=UPI0024A8615E|nr:hypothetical protein [Streptomyces sp. CC208A]
MHGRDSWLTRTSKGLLCASACLLLGAVSHVAAGGSLPGAGELGLVFTGLTVLGTILFGGRRRRFDVTTAVLGATQFGLHLALHRLSMMPLAGGEDRHAMAGHQPGAHAHMHMQMAETAHSGSAHAMTAPMAVAHALATLGTALCVGYGERILLRLAALLLPRLGLAVLAPCPVPPARRAPAPFTAGHVRLRVLLARCRPRRGPPLVIPA